MPSKSWKIAPVYQKVVVLNFLALYSQNKDDLL